MSIRQTPDGTVFVEPTEYLPGYILARIMDLMNGNPDASDLDTVWQPLERDIRAWHDREMTMLFRHVRDHAHVRHLHYSAHRPVWEAVGEAVGVCHNHTFPIDT